MSRVIAVAISKGGTGKTTTAVNLAAGLARRGARVLLADLDTQGQASFCLGVKPRHGLAELVTGEAKAEDVLVKARDDLWLIAGGRALAGIKRLIDRKDFGGESTIAEALAPIAARFDYVLLDCAPGWDALTVNALFAVQEVLAPVSCEMMSLQGLGEFTKSLSAVRQYRPALRLRYVLPTFADGRTPRKTREILETLQSHYPREVCAPIRYSGKLASAAGRGRTIFEADPHGHGAEDYDKLAERIQADGQE